MNFRQAIAASTLVAGLLAGLSTPLPAQRGRDQEIFNQAKIFMFDKKWGEAHDVFLRLIREFPGSNVVPQAYFFSARCLQLQGKPGDAIRAYEDFVRKYPLEPILPAEARNSIVEIAALLFEKGDRSYKDRLAAALADGRKEVRYFAALRCSSLKDLQLDSMIIPILKDIVSGETERELVDRAEIALLRLEPKALSPRTRPEKPPVKPSEDRGRASEKPGAGRMFHLRVFEEGSSEPKVELNIPVSLAQLAIAALDESAKKEMRLKGFDVDNIWESLNKMGPTDILTFRDGKTTVKLWIK